nr:synaptobrevin, longin-like domain protein [Tanacetum cinerariifolium]
LQALVDKKRIVITEEVVREILQLNDAEGAICLPNDEIFAGLARMRYEKPSTKLTFYKAFFSTQWKFFIHTILHSLSAKRTSWNEFSSTMASALICLSSGQRFNFLKYIFESLVRNVDSSSKFYMYPRVGKGFSRVETPLFETMLAVKDVAEEAEAQIIAQGDDVQEHAKEEVATDVLDTCSALVLRVEGLENANAAQQLEIVKLKARVKKLERLNKVKSSKLRRLKKVGTSQHVKSSDDVDNVFNQGRMSVDMETDEGIELVVDQEKNAEVEGRHADKQAEIYNIDLDHSSKVLSMQEDDTEVQEAVEVVTTAKLIIEVVTAAATQVVTASTPISAAKPKVLKIASALAVSTRKRKEVVIRDPKEELHIDTLTETPTVKDKGKGILIEDPKPMKKKDQVEMDAEYAKKLQEELNKEHEKPQSESEARKNMISYLKNTEGYNMEFFKGKTYDQIIPIFQARFDANLKFLFKSREEMEKKDEEIIKSINETPVQKAAKRRKLTTPLTQKVPAVDYQVVVIDNNLKREVGYGITDSWDEIVETLQGAPVSTDMELGGYVREFETRVRQDTDEIYMRLDDEHTERHLLAGRLNMLFKDRRAHAYTSHLMETEARMSREAWVRATDASDLVHGEVMSLRTTVLGQMLEIRELKAADRRRQTVILELLWIDHRRSTEILELRTALQGQVTALQAHVTILQGLSESPTQSRLPDEAGGSA